MIKNIIVVLLFLFPLVNSAQNENNIWYFGNEAGLDFNSGSPIADTNSTMIIGEGSSSICDTNGNLLFYTDGRQVRNRLHQTMPNGIGLTGDFSSTQSAIIVKKPLSSNLYYIFTVAKEAGFHGMRYSIVDMTLDGGLGDITCFKNVGITDNVCEKLTAIKHQNDTAFWIIVHKFNSNAFYSYLFTPSGLQTPVISNVGPVIVNDTSTFSIGYMKASKDGSRLAMANWIFGDVEVFDFDNITGIVSNPIILPLNTDTSAQLPPFPFLSEGPYGVEFSPNGNLLYASYQLNIFQYNLLAGSAFAINTSRIRIDTTACSPIGPPTYPLIFCAQQGALQLGPDDKIYAAKNWDSTLGVITDPNIVGMSCNYLDSAIWLGGKRSRVGLPLAFASVYGPSTPLFCQGGNCFGTPTTFTYQSAVDSVLWNFDDPITGTNNTSMDLNASHLFSDTGSFSVSLIIYNGGFTDTIINMVHIFPPPIFDLGNDTTICPGESMVLDASVPNASYLWHDGSTGPTFDLSTQGNQWGTYWVQVSLNGCTLTDTILINNFIPPTAVSFGSDTSLCAGDTLVLHADQVAVDYLWQDNSDSSAFVVTQPGTYWVQVSNFCGSDADTINVDYNFVLSVDLGNDTLICPGESLTLDATSPNVNYLWNDNSTNSTLTVSSAGTYWVQVSSTNCGTASDTIDISLGGPPIFDLGNDTTICAGSMLTLNATVAGGSYIWSDTSTDSVLTVNLPGTYWVQVTANGCIRTDTITISNFDPLMINLQNDTSLCTGDSLELYAPFTGVTYLWQDNSTDSTFNVTQAGTYWVQISNACESVADTVIIDYNLMLSVNLGNDTALCPGETLFMDATTPNVNYLWQDNSTGPTFNVTQQGSYWVEISSTNCAAVSDTIDVSYGTVASLELGNDTTLCMAETLDLNVASLGATYLWQDNSTDSTFNINQAGTYWVTVTTGNCSVSDTLEVAHGVPTVNLGNDTSICSGLTLTLDATNINSTYLWQDNSTNPTYNVTQQGTYWVSVMNICGSASDTMDVAISFPQIDLGNDTVLCAGETLTLNAFYPGAWLYWWSNATNDTTLTVTQQGIYSVLVLTPCGWLNDTISVGYVPFPNVDFGNDTALCQGEMLTLDATNLSSDYLWQDGSMNSTYTVNQSGNYWVEVKVSGCTTTDSITIDYHPALNLEFGNDTVLCPGQTLFLEAPSNGTSYLWQDGSTGSTYLVNQAGTYWVQITDTCNNIVSDTLNVNYNQIQTVWLGNDTSLCIGQTITLNAFAQNAVSYLWQDNSTNSSFTVTQQGNYWVQVTDICNNVVVDSIDVDFNPVPNINLGNDTMLCPNLTHTADATTPGATYLWQDGSVNATYSISQTGTYWVTATNNCGTDADTVSITYHLPFDIDFVDDTVLCPNEVLVLDATTPNTTYLWSDFSTGPVFTITEAGSYWVEVRNICNALFEIINVSFEDCTNRILMPNVFTPNGDGENETFTPVKFEGVLQADIVIFDRWGNEIYQSDDLTNGWTGICNGGDCANGTYYWIVNFVDINNTPSTIKGFVTLLR